MRNHRFKKLLRNMESSENQRRTGTFGSEKQKSDARFLKQLQAGMRDLKIPRFKPDFADNIIDRLETMPELSLDLLLYRQFKPLLIGSLLGIMAFLLLNQGDANENIIPHYQRS